MSAAPNSGAPVTKPTRQATDKRPRGSSRSTSEVLTAISLKSPPTEQAPLNSLESEEFDFSLQVGYLLRKSYQRHTAIFQALCSDPQLTQVQFAVLCAIGGLGTSSLKQIGKAAALDPATTGSVIDRLKDRELVVANLDTSDRRKVLVALTNEGRELIKTMIPVGKNISEMTLSGLTEAEKLTFISLLRKTSVS